MAGVFACGIVLLANRREKLFGEIYLPCDALAIALYDDYVFMIFYSAVKNVGVNLYYLLKAHCNLGSLPPEKRCSANNQGKLP